jgi:hypothetical protein
VRGVAAWERRPSADDLLRDRVARGWKPTASLLKEGEKVIGHACTVAR